MSTDEFDIEIFFEDNYYLFTVMGIFGALATYLSTLITKAPPETTRQVLQIGIVSSILLFLLVSVVIFYNAFKNYDNLSIFFPLTKGKLVRIFFIVPFFLLIYAVTMYAFISFPLERDIVIGSISIFVGVMLFLGILKLIENINNKFVVLVLILLFTISSAGQQCSIKYKFIPGILFCNPIIFLSFIAIVSIVTRDIYRKIKKIPDYFRTR